MKKFSVFFSASQIFFLILFSWINNIEGIVLAILGITYAHYLAVRAWTPEEND